MANRKYCELLVLALGGANFKGKLSSLTTEMALFPSFGDENTIHTDEERSTSDIQSTLYDEILNEMNRLLLSNDFTISRIHHNLVASLATNCELVNLSRDSEQVKKSTLKKCGAKANKLKDAHINENAAQQKSATALINEKAVLLAALGSRDEKIDGLAKQVSELVKGCSLQSEELSTIDRLRSDLIRERDNSLSAKKVIAKMKEKENELQNDLTRAKEKQQKWNPNVDN